MPDSSYNRTITQAIITQGAAGQLDLVAIPGTGVRIYVVTLVASITITGTVVFQEGTGPTNLTGAMTLTAGTPLTLFGSAAEPVLATNTANSKLSLTSVTGAITGYLRYYLAP